MIRSFLFNRTNKSCPLYDKSILNILENTKLTKKLKKNATVVIINKLSDVMPEADSLSKAANVKTRNDIIKNNEQNTISIK